jgi:hypothetical protein
MNQRQMWGLLFALLAALVLSATGCGAPGPSAPTSTPTVPASPPTLTPTAPASPPTAGDVIIAEANVESVDVLIMESYPVQVRAVVRGNLPDGCTEISHSTQRVEGATIRIALFTKRPADLMCTQALVPYEESIPVDIAGLADGHYTVEINGVRAALDLQGGGN